MEKINLTLAVNIYNQEKEISTFGKDIIYFIKKLIEEDLISEKSCIFFIDQNSKDNSWYEISKEKVRYPNLYKAIKLRKKVKNKAIFNYLSEQNNDLIILIDLNYKKEEIIKSIKENTKGVLNHQKQTFLQGIKNPFYSNKINIEEELL